MFYIHQNDAGDCGYACVKMLLANLNNDKNYLYLSSPKARNSTFTYKELIYHANKYGTELSGYKVEDKQELHNANNFPMLISLYGKRFRHMVYVYKRKKNVLYYLDPDKGKCKTKIDELIEKWDGTLLLVKQTHQNKCPIKRIDLLKKKEKILLVSTQLLSGVGLLTGIYLLQKEINLVYPIIAFSVFVIFEVLLRRISIWLMSKMDDRVFEKGKVKSRYFKDFYYHFEQYKQKEIMLPLNIVYEVFVSSALIVLLALNDKQNIYYIVASVVLALTFALIVNPALRKEKEEINSDEREINHIQNMKGLSLFMNKIHTKSYKYGLKELATRYIAIFGELLIILVVMASTKQIQLPYVVFYLTANYLLTMNLTKIFEYPKEMNDFDNVSAKLSNTLINK